MNKLALGTVQFGLDYGVNNSMGKVKPEEVRKILELAHNNGIDMLDTARVYGDSEKVIGCALSRSGIEFKIISKFSALHRDLRTILMDSLKELKIEKLYGYIFHDFKNFKENPALFDELKKLKSEGRIEKIGFSLYHPAELLYLQSKGIEFDLVQFPYSVFDQRFACYLPNLKAAGTEVHVRSAFLQGLVFMDQDHLPSHLASIKLKLGRLRDIAAEANLPISSLCLSFCLLNNQIDRTLIGVDSLENLEENLESTNQIDAVKKVYPKLLRLREDNERIILPINWKR